MQIDPFLGKGKRLQDDRKEARRRELKNKKMESKRLSDSQNFQGLVELDLYISQSDDICCSSFVMVL